MRDLRVPRDIACVLWFAYAACACASDAQSLNVKLSEGEVLEMASGEVAKAAALYREVLGDAQDAVRARALYLLARCERKLGNLKSAEALLEEVLAKHAGCTPFNERAERLLSEIRDAGRSGAGEWLRGLRENESIQAQLFQMAMGLVSPDSDEGKNAAAKLLAMGSLAQPVLRTVIQTTRDPIHRRQLALILAQMGDFEALGAALDTLGDPDAFAKTAALDTLVRIIPSFDLERKQELREAIAKLPAAPAAEEVRALCALAASDAATFDASLTRFDRSWSGAFDKSGTLRRLLENRLKQDPQAASVLVAHLGDDASKLVTWYFEALRRAAPSALTAEVLRGLRPDFDQDAAEILLDRKDYAALAAFFDMLSAHDRAASDAHRHTRVIESMAGHLGRFDLASGDPSIGALIRAVLLGSPYSWGLFHLVRFFFTQGPALPEFEKIVRYAAENDRWLTMHDAIGPERTPPPPIGDAFLALARSLAVDADPRVRTKVLNECLGFLIPHDPASVQTLARHLHDPSVMLPENKAAAAKLLLVAVEEDPAVAEEVAAVLVKDHAITRESYERWAIGDDTGLALAAPLLMRLDGEADAALCAWALGGGGREQTQRESSIVRAVPGRPSAVPGRPSLSPGRFPVSIPSKAPYYLMRAPKGPQPSRSGEKHIALCVQAIEKHGAGPRRALLGALLCKYPKDVVASPQVSAFLDAIVADGSLPLETRVAVLELRAPATPIDVLKEFLVGDDDIIAMALLPAGGPGLANQGWFRARSHEEKRTLIGHLAQGPLKRLAVEPTAFQYFQGEECAAILGKLTADPDLNIRTRACRAFVNIKTPAVKALFIARLKDADATIRKMAVIYLDSFGGERAMEALAGVLDDAHPDVRNTALGTLRKLREQETERELWQKWLQDRQKPHAAPGNAPPARP